MFRSRDDGVMGVSEAGPCYGAAPPGVKERRHSAATARRPRGLSRGASWSTKSGSASPPGQKSEHERKGEAQKNAGAEGDVDPHVAAAQRDVAREPPQESRQVLSEQEKQAGGRQEDPEQQDHPAESLGGVRWHGVRHYRRGGRTTWTRRSRRS